MPASRNRAGRVRRTVIVLTIVTLAYAGFAYVAAPLVWDVIFDRKKLVTDSEPRLTETSDHRPGDPLNVALIGDEAAVKAAMTAAGWLAADPLGVKSSLEIAADIVLERPYTTAPVSRLFLFGRSEDLAFEKPEGRDPDKRHHVRFWRLAATPGQAAPGWIGAASFDRGIGFSHETGQLTHHIAAEVDLERDNLRADLTGAGRLTDSYMMPGFHKVLSGRNGGDDAWVTDGDLWVGVLGNGS